MKPTIRDLNIRILNEDTFTIYDGETLISTCHISDSEFEFIKESPCLGGSSWIFKVPRGLRINIHDEFISLHLKELPDFLPYAENVYVTQKIVSCFNPIVPLDATFTYIHRFIADLYSDFYAKYEDEEKEELSKEFTEVHFYRVYNSLMFGKLVGDNVIDEVFFLKYDYKEKALILSKVINDKIKEISIDTIDPFSDFKDNIAFLESIFPKTIRVIELHELPSEYCCMIQDIFMKWFKFNYCKELDFDLANGNITFSFQ